MNCWRWKIYWDSPQISTFSINLYIEFGTSSIIIKMDMFFLTGVVSSFLRWE